MKREIKFKGFDTETKEKLESITLLEFMQLGNGIGEELSEDIMKHWEDKVVLMQYTGLKDKNGKEIYEGDIVELIGGHDIVIIEWYNVSFAGFIGKSIKKQNETYNYISSLTHTIIGNIYETPELL